jgi:DNA-binding Lrp family transcriptional regulator
MVMQLDDTDRKLIALLRHDARAPVSTLAVDLKLSRATIKTRIDRLVENNIIQGFTVVLKAGAESAKVKAMMLVEIEGQWTDKLSKRLVGIPQVRTIYSTNGRWDLVVEIETETLEEFDTVLREIRALEGIITSETNLLLSRRKG